MVPLSKCWLGYCAYAWINSLNLILVKFDHSNAMECLDIRRGDCTRMCVRDTACAPKIESVWVCFVFELEICSGWNAKEISIIWSPKQKKALVAVRTVSPVFQLCSIYIYCYCFCSCCGCVWNSVAVHFLIVFYPNCNRQANKWLSVHFTVQLCACVRVSFKSLKFHLFEIE